MFRFGYVFQSWGKYLGIFVRHYLTWPTNHNEWQSCVKVTRGSAVPLKKCQKYCSREVKKYFVLWRKAR